VMILHGRYSRVTGRLIFCEFETMSVDMYEDGGIVQPDHSHTQLENTFMNIAEKLAQLAAELDGWRCNARAFKECPETVAEDWSQEEFLARQSEIVNEIEELNKELSEFPTSVKFMTDLSKVDVDEDSQEALVFLVTQLTGEFCSETFEFQVTLEPRFTSTQVTVAVIKNKEDGLDSNKFRDPEEVLFEHGREWAECQEVVSPALDVLFRNLGLTVRPDDGAILWAETILK